MTDDAADDATDETPIVEALNGLCQRAIGGAKEPELRALAEPIGRYLVASGRGASAVLYAGMEAANAIFATSDNAARPPEAVTQAILRATALVIDSWTSIAIGAVAALRPQDVQTQELQEHVRQLESLAVIDSLTNLYNRRHFDTALDTEIARAQRYRLDMCLIIVDIDHFKRINDTHGHLVGDEVLCHVSDILRAQARKSDVVSRFGGEEFTVILTETSLASAAIAVERMRGAVEAAPAKLADGTAIAATISLGYSALQEDDTPRSVLERADAALYRAKQDGRNRAAC